MSIDNSHLIGLMNNLKEEYTLENQKALLDAIAKATVLVPTIPTEVEDRILPIPASVSTPDGKLYQPLFTDEAHTDEKAEEDGVEIIEMPFEQLATVVVRQNETYKKAGENLKPVTGIVINPSTQAIVLPTAVLRNLLNELAVAKMPDEQYAVFARCKFEQLHLPTLFFDKGENFVEMLIQHKAKFIYDMAKTTYLESRTFPYDLDDFAVNAIRVENEVIIVKIDMPEKYRVLGTAEAAYLVVKKDSDMKRFFTTVLEPGKEEPKRLIIEIFANKKAAAIGDAPAEGTDINWILKMIG